MSASNEWFKYHLTPRGWIAGSEKIDFAGLKEKEIPDDRVLTLCFHEYLSSPFSTMDKWYKEMWRHEDEALINDLIRQFGELPESYLNSGYSKR